MNFIKLQLGCFLITSYLAFDYWRKAPAKHGKHHLDDYSLILLFSLSEILFDGLTAYFVNHQELIHPLGNALLHAAFFLSIDAVIFCGFLYLLHLSYMYPRTKKMQCLLISPLCINVILIFVFLPELEYRIGKITNYSMGTSAVSCYVTAGIYLLLTFFIFLRQWKYIEHRKRSSIAVYTTAILLVVVFQSIFPEILITCLAPTILAFGIYLNQENPDYSELKEVHNEMITGFATLVENRDDNTGGHIKRTSLYVELLARALYEQGYYRDIITRDYQDVLTKAAAMHDIGKIAVPDSILCKPGKLTTEEFEIIKLHTVRGGKIIRETFGHLNDTDFTEIAYKLAMYHHEKWNGRGYPEGRKETDIPLCARIMSVADVFDAVSAKRCYRDAMPLNQCFEIVQQGRGTDFEPLIADTFLSLRPEVEQIYRENSQAEPEFPSKEDLSL